MERLYSTTKTSNTNLFSDPLHRMSQRPCSVKTGKGLGFQELGSSFGPSKPVTTYKSKSKPPLGLRKAPHPILEDSSDDELLLGSSQPDTIDDATSSPKRVVKAKKQDFSSDEEEKVRVNGRVLAAHPDYKPSSFDAVKKLRFKRNKESTPAGDAAEEVPPPSSSMNLSQKLSKPISNDVEIVEDALGSPPRPSGTSSRRRRSPSTTRTRDRWLPDAKDSQTPKPTSLKDVSRPITKPRPRPRVVISRKPDINPDSTPRAIAQNREKTTNAENERTAKKRSTSRRELQEFPMSLQAKENISDGARSDDGSSSKTKKAVTSRAATSAQKPKSIPLPSPLRTTPVSRATTFPNLSPLSSSLDKGKARAKSPEEVDLTGGQRKRRGPQPFPMNSQMLAGIDRRSTSPSSYSPRSTKRASSDDSEAEQGRTAKKHKDSRSRVPDLFDYLNEPMEDDSLDTGHARDPSKICAYCDEDLPPHPTPLLRHLFAMARKKSVSDPRPRNRGGLRAPLMVYISVCQRHRFELHQLPIAIKKGWPQTIDFAKVPARVRKMKKTLEAIILDRDSFSNGEDPDFDGKQRRPRGKSVFWGEVKKEVRQQGSRTVVGVKGQFASFEKTQPGYYGEQGSVIIHQTLFDLFPPSTFDASLIAPLAPAEFIQRVLVPEAAVRLIAQDLSVEMDDALVTLRDSAQYGVAMFPDTGETRHKGHGGADDDEMDVADRIVMERARARRKELAEEEKVEKQMLEEERAAQRARARESRREKAVERAQQARQLKTRAEGKADTESLSEASETGDTRRTRRGTRQQAITGGSESDAMSVDDLACRQALCVTKKGKQTDTIKVVKVAEQSNASDSDSIEFIDDSAHKANAGGTKTKERTAEPDLRIKTGHAMPSGPKNPFAEFASLDNDETPRAGRQRKADASATGGPVSALPVRVLPLQVARNRNGASAPAPCDGWSQSLLTNLPDDVDSDTSNASRRSRSLVRPPIKKAESYNWLFSPESSQGSS